MIHYFQSLIVLHGSIAVFFVGIAEDILFFVPSSLVFMGAGFVMIPGNVHWWQALWMASLKIGIPATLGVTFGAIFVYRAVYILGKPVVTRYGKYLGVRWSDVEKFQQKFAHGWSDELILFVARALPIFPLSIASIAAGLVRIPWKEFVGITLIGVFFRATMSAFLGWHVGKAYEEFANQFRIGEYIVLGILFVLLIVYWFMERRRNRRANTGGLTS